MVMNTVDQLEFEQQMAEIAADLDGLQSKENEGRGIDCVRTIVTYLKRGDLRYACAVMNNEGDKLRNYPALFSKFRELQDLAAAYALYPEHPSWGSLWGEMIAELPHDYSEEQQEEF